MYSAIDPPSGPHPPTSSGQGVSGAGGRVVFPHRIRRPNHAPVTDLQGDVGLTDLSTICQNASAIASKALQQSLLPSTNTNKARASSSLDFSNIHGSKENANTSALSTTGAYAKAPTAAADPSTQAQQQQAPRYSSAVGVLRNRIAEAGLVGGGVLNPTSKLVSSSVTASFSPTTDWFNGRRYHPTDVMLSPLLQEKQLQELKELMYAPPKGGRAKSIVSPTADNNNGGGGESSAFLTSTNLEGGGGANASASSNQQSPPSAGGSKKKKGAGALNTSALNGMIGLRRMPNNDAALNDLYARHSVALKPADAPFFGGALTTEGGGAKKGAASATAGGGGGSSSRGNSVVAITTANVNTALAASASSKKKGPVAPLISNVAAIHRGLAPHMTPKGQIPIRHVIHFLATLVPPEYEASATKAYIRPFLRRCYDEFAALQNTNGGSAVAGTAGQDAEDVLNQTNTSGTTESGGLLPDNTDVASTVGGRSGRATSHAGTVRIQSIADGLITGSSRAASPNAFQNAISAAAARHHHSPSTASLGGVGGIGRLGGGGAASATAASLQQQQLLLEQQRIARERQEDAFFNTVELPYTHVIACFEVLMRPPAPPASSNVAEEVAGCVLSARVCFQLCDPLNRGYITKESVKAMRDDSSTNEDYNFNVVQGLLRGLSIIEKLEEERYAVLGKKGRKGGKNSKKPVPMPTTRQFHMSLDEFTHLMGTDAYIPLAFLPYIIKTLMNGTRDAVAGQKMTHFGKSQVAFSALQRANFREKQAAESNLEAPIRLDTMNAEAIQKVLQRREYPPIVSALAFGNDAKGGGRGGGGRGGGVGGADAAVNTSTHTTAGTNSAAPAIMAMGMSGAGSAVRTPSERSSSAAQSGQQQQQQQGDGADGTSKRFSMNAASNTSRLSVSGMA